MAAGMVYIQSQMKTFVWKVVKNPHVRAFLAKRCSPFAGGKGGAAFLARGLLGDMWPRVGKHTKPTSLQ